VKFSYVPNAFFHELSVRIIFIMTSSDHNRMMKILDTTLLTKLKTQRYK